MMQRLAWVVALWALSGCGKLTDGFFNGQSANPSATPSVSTTGSTGSTGSTTASTAGGSTGSTTSSTAGGSTGATTSSTAGGSTGATTSTTTVVCDNTVAFSGNQNTAAMYDSAISDTVAFVIADSATTKIAVYEVFSTPLGNGSSQGSVTLSPSSSDSTVCSPCIVATYNGKSYTPESGTLEVDFNGGTTGTMTVTLTNAKFVPADGTGGGWCIQDLQAAQNFAPYQCSLVGAANGCVSLLQTSAKVTCATNDTMHVVQDCSSTQLTCSTATGNCQ